ncbi:MAG TPA: hypothetical protein DCZ20_04900 [Lachnospiraceae bacterium]|nr:hypothetical protein [Lachnospiraceae bacterium]
MKILIVDDELIALNILKQSVRWRELGITEVYTAMNADAAKKILMTENIDLALCDIELPGESGLDLICWIQKIYPGIVCIILTAFPDFNYARSAISLGVFEYLLKPTSPTEIESTVKKAIERIEADRTPQPVDGTESVRDQDAVAAVKQYIEKHYNDVITRNMLEKLVSFNHDYLNRIFKKETGYSLIEYIQYYRIIMAKKLLRTTSLSVAEIGEKIGIDEPAYFIRVFRKWTGMTPGNYRREHDSDN